MPAKQARKGRHREQYSCTECFRRKQKCNRTFPCNNCISRRLPHRCMPPSEPGNVRGSAAESSRQASEHDFLHTTEIDLDTPPLTNDPPSTNSVYPIRSPRDALYRTTQQPASIQTLADIATRLGSLETSLAARGMLEHGDVSRTSVVSTRSMEAPIWREGSIETHQTIRPEACQRSLNGADTLLLDDWLATRAQSNYEATRQRQESQPGPSHTPRRSLRFGAARIAATGIQTPAEIDHEAAANGSPEYEVAANWMSNPVAIATNPTLRHVGPGYGLVVPISHLELIYKALPTLAECKPIVQAFLSCFNFSSVPLQSSYVLGRLQKLSETLPTSSSKDSDPVPTPSSMLRPYSTLLSRISQVALLLAVLVLGSLKPSQRILPTSASRKYFYACKTALSLCECVGVATYDSCWAHALLASYLELVRVPRGAWTHVVSSSRDAIDLNLHSPFANRNISRVAKAARRLLWLQVLLKDREWGAIYGRPFSYGGSSVNLPTEKDFTLLNVDFKTSQSLRARAAFLPCIEAIASLQQATHANTASDGKRFDQRSYDQAFSIDGQIQRYLACLPPCLQSLLDERPDAMCDPKDLYLRHTVIEPVLFFRTLLHRPFMLCLLDDDDVNGASHPYAHSRALCTALALQSQRCLAQLQMVLPPALASQHYACAYSTFNADIILGQSIVQGLQLGEYESSDSVAEKLSFILQYVIQVRQNIEEGIGDHFAAKEALVMRSIHGRLVNAIRQRRRSGTLPPAFEDAATYVGSSRVAHLVTRIGKELDVAETTLRHMDPGVRVDRGHQNGVEKRPSVPLLLDDTSLFMSMASVPRLSDDRGDTMFDILSDTSNVDLWTSDFFQSILDGPPLVDGTPTSMQHLTPSTTNML